MPSRGCGQRGGTGQWRGWRQPAQPKYGSNRRCLANRSGVAGPMRVSPTTPDGTGGTVCRNLYTRRGSSGAGDESGHRLPYRGPFDQHHAPRRQPTAKSSRAAQSSLPRSPAKGKPDQRAMGGHTRSAVQRRQGRRIKPLGRSLRAIVPAMCPRTVRSRRRVQKPSRQRECGI